MSTKDLISKKTRYEFREYFVEKTLREIEIEFDSADVEFDADFTPDCTGQRRSRVEQYYHTVNWSRWKDVRRVLDVYQNVLAHLEDRAEQGDGHTYGEIARKRFQSLRKWVERDGFVYRDGRLDARTDVAHLPDVHEAATAFDAPELQRQVARMREAVDDDPALAIGTAKELVETTCKTILEDRGVQYGKGDDVPKLVKATRKVLGLMPEDIPESAKGVKSIRRLLSSLGAAAQALGELRNLYGTGHGRHGRSGGLNARHARLAVGAAATLALFLFETHQEREQRQRGC